MNKRQLLIEMEAVEIALDGALTQREYLALRRKLQELQEKLEREGDENGL